MQRMSFEEEHLLNRNFREERVTSKYYDKNCEEYLIKTLVYELQRTINGILNGKADVFQCEDVNRRFVPRWRIKNSDGDCDIIVDFSNSTLNVSSIEVAPQESQNKYSGDVGGINDTKVDSNSISPETSFKDKKKIDLSGHDRPINLNADTVKNGEYKARKVNKDDDNNNNNKLIKKIRKTHEKDLHANNCVQHPVKEDLSRNLSTSSQMKRVPLNGFEEMEENEPKKCCTQTGLKIHRKKKLKQRQKYYARRSKGKFDLEPEIKLESCDSDFSKRYSTSREFRSSTKIKIKQEVI